MSEKSLWKWLRDGPLPDGNYSRVESPDTCPGIPDVYYRLDWHCGWFELKFDRHPKKEYPFENENDGLHLSQRVWIQNEIDLGGRVFLVVELNREVAWLDMRRCSIENFNFWNRSQIRKHSDYILSKPLRRNETSRIQQDLLTLMTGE